MSWADGVSFDFTPTVVALLVLGAIAAAVLVVPLGRWLFGPLFALELIRAAHSRRMYLVRVAYAAALLVTLIVTFPSESKLQKQAIEAFANQFSTLFLLIQSIAAMLLTPIVFGSAISGDKERRSLDFLLVTPLSAAEIVIGKYVGWFLNLMGVLLTGLPILALTIFWGGVDLRVVLCVFASQAFAILSFGAIAICCSVMFEHSIHAVICAAILTALIALGCGGRLVSPIGFQAAIEQMYQFPMRIVAIGPVGRYVTGPGRLLVYFGLIHGVLAIFGLGLSILFLRRKGRRADIHSAYAGEMQYPFPAPPRPYVPTMISANPIRGDALLWRERRLGYLSDPYFDTFWLYFAGFLCLLAMASWALSDTSAVELVKIAFRLSSAVLIAGLCLVLLMRLAGCVSREREHRTLESLLSLPINRGRILYVKWLGAALRTNRWAGALVAGLVLGALSGAFRPLEAALLMLLGFSWAAFVSALSLCASVFARTTLRAYVYAIVAVVAVLAIATLDVQFRESRPAMANEFVSSTRYALSPFHACKMTAEVEFSNLPLAVPLLAAAFLYSTAGLVIAAIAYWRFHREEEYT